MIENKKLIHLVKIFLHKEQKRRIFQMNSSCKVKIIIILTQICLKDLIKIIS